MLWDNEPVDFDPWARNRVVEKRVKREDFWERMGDVYIALLAAAIVFGYAAGLALAFFDNLRGGPGSGIVRAGAGVVPGSSAASALVMLGMLGALLLISKLGPTAVDRAQGFWWLSLPVARTGFLARLLRQRLVSTFLYGGFLWLPIGYGTVLGGLARGSFAGVLAGAATLGLLFVGLSLLAAWSQTRQAAGRFRALLNAAAIGVLLAYLIDVLLRITGLGNLESLWAWLPSSLPVLAQTGAWWVPAVLAVLCAGGFAALAGQLQRIPSRELISSGAASEHAGAALALLDDKALGSALDAAGARESKRTRARRERIRARGSDSFARMLPARWVRGPYAALVRAELLVLLRTGKSWRGMLVGWCVPAAGVFAVPGGRPLVLAVLVLVGSVLAARAASKAAAQAAGVPSLDAIIPLGRVGVRQTHALVAALLLVPWSVCLAGFLGWAVGIDAGEIPLLLGLGAMAGVGLAAGAVRMAFRPAIDWGSVMLMAAMGQAAGPMVLHFTYGYDVMAVSVVALVAGLLLAPIPSVLLLLGAVVAAMAWGVGTSTANPSNVHRAQL
ncbi:DUF6297 family protein [Paeniglutamicibacter psychrophenolicus]|uniref:DUF6297 family protein n=1 Tax=Paeniglutamicibacter psychrophenolicus TaxID=257454 RepID=UPI0027862A59|nr:DUF6297 family protein [Paeniglutamicibacter psychrophenolicus]MDQ0096224.1 hypothetical protein [Paeniglutamicibacter psychrophenolicus]